MIDVEVLNLVAGFALLTDGRTVPVTNMFDADQDETEDPAEAVTFVAGDGRMWFSGAVGSYEPVSPQ